MMEIMSPLKGASFEMFELLRCVTWGIVIDVGIWPLRC
jgi:hypothetical protein